MRELKVEISAGARHGRASAAGRQRRQAGRQASSPLSSAGFRGGGGTYRPKA